MTDYRIVLARLQGKFGKSNGDPFAALDRMAKRIAELERLEAERIPWMSREEAEMRQTEPIGFTITGNELHDYRPSGFSIEEPPAGVHVSGEVEGEIEQDRRLR